MMAADDERLLMPGEAAAQVGVSVRTLSRWANEGKLRCVMMPSGHRKYRESDIEKAPAKAPRPGKPVLGRGPMPPGAPAGPSPGSGEGTPTRGADARLAAHSTPPGAGLAETASQQQGASAGLSAAPASGGSTPINYGRRA